MEYGLIGEKLGHSFSAEIHKLIGDYPYELRELTPDDVNGFFAERDFRGVNVTIPYKKKAAHNVDKLDLAAQKTLSVNTVVNRDGVLWGYNTDFTGMIALIRRVLSQTGKHDFSGMKIVILGTGGAGATAAAAASYLRAGTVIRVSRTQRPGTITYEKLPAHFDADFIINCTPVGMYPDTQGKPISLSGFTKLCGVADVIYNPLRTPLIREAKRLGIAAEGGLYMLVAQAVAAYGCFMGKEPERSLTANIYKKIYSAKENIVLIGMPTSGKSTVGRILAKRLKRELIDTDREIEKREGRKIAEIFASDGEKYFREAEKQAVAEAADRTGVIIATGGGTVLDPENVDRLRANGAIYWLDRPLADLFPSKKRPVAATEDELAARYNERYGLYQSACDVRVDCSADLPRTLSQIIGRRR